MSATAQTEDRAAQQEQFLLQLRAHGLVTAAADSVAVSRRCLYLWRTADPMFAARWDNALAEARARISSALKRGAADVATATAALDQVARQIANPDLDADSRATLLDQLATLHERIDELRALATSEAAQAHQRFVAEARAQLRKECDDAEAVAAEFDAAVKALDPAFKRLRAALAAVRTTGLRAEVPTPEVAFDTLMRCGLHFHAPEFASYLGVLRPDRRHQSEFSKFVQKRRPGEVA